MSSPTSSTFTPRPTPAPAPPSRPYLCGSNTCLPAPGVISRYFKPRWPTPMTGAWPTKSRATARLMMTSLLWQSNLRGTSMTLMLHGPASCPVSHVLCLLMPRNMSSCSKTWLGSQVLYAQGGRELTGEYGAPMSEDIHCRGRKGDDTGLGAALELAPM
jgi:hypothetical protein